MEQTETERNHGIFEHETIKKTKKNLFSTKMRKRNNPHRNIRFLQLIYLNFFILYINIEIDLPVFLFKFFPINLVRMLKFFPFRVLS